MKEFHGFYLKIRENHTEIYKNRQFIASTDDEEKAKSFIIELEKETEGKTETKTE